MKLKQTILTEYEEQCLLVEWLELKNIKFSKIAQDTFTRSWATKMKNQRSGVRPGVPDMIIILPTDELLFIEMKRTKGGVISKEQKEWVEALNNIPNVIAVIAKGFDEARGIIEKLLR